MADSPLFLAVYGFVEESAGGLASANFCLLEGLLRQGHRVDFYAIEPFVRPERLFACPGFRYRGQRLDRLERGWRWLDRLPRMLRQPAAFAYSQLVNHFYYQRIERAIGRAHRRRPYDALLTLGLLSPFHLPKIPTVSWTQGTPNGELEAIIRQRRTLVSLCGWGLYLALGFYYRCKTALVRRQICWSGRVIDGSRWALESWRRLGLPADHAFALPYIIDLERLTPVARPPAPGQPTVLLHLGRLVPRKRLDLLLEAFQLFRRSEPTARLRVIGSFSYARGYARLLAERRLMGNVEYQPAVPREQALEALRQADILVQVSENENFGTAVAEALSCGVPVVVGPSNGTKDYLPSLEFVFSAYEPAAVADALLRLVQAQRDQRQALAAAARAAAEKHFDCDAVVRQLCSLIRDAGDRHRSKSV